MKEKWLPYYILVFALILWLSGPAWLPFIIILGLIGFGVYRFYNCRDLERVTTVLVVGLGILMALGLRTGFVSGLFLFSLIVDLVL